MPRARGISLAQLARHPLLGGERWAHLLELLPEGVREVIARGVDPARWYPESYHLALYRAVATLLGDDDDEITHFFWDTQRMALVSARRTRFHTLGAVLAQTPARWRQGHDTGHLSIRRHGDGVDAALRGHPFAMEPVYRQMVLGEIAALVSDIVDVDRLEHAQGGPQEARFRIAW